VKKPTAADRPQFRRDVANMMEALNVQVSEVNSEAIVLCTRASDFDPDDNVLWENEANKSAVRADVHCFSCQSPLAMSNHMYERYTALDKRPRACCVQCAVMVLKEMR
jgi:hypothetical protein